MIECETFLCSLTPHSLNHSLTYTKALLARQVVGRHCLSTSACACMHIRMPGGDGCDPNSLPQPYPGSTASRLWSSGLNYGPHFRGRADPAQDVPAPTSKTLTFILTLTPAPP